MYIRFEMVAGAACLAPLPPFSPWTSQEVVSAHHILTRLVRAPPLSLPSQASPEIARKNPSLFLGKVATV